jgi:hypothetical protein
MLVSALAALPSAWVIYTVFSLMCTDNDVLVMDVVIAVNGSDFGRNSPHGYGCQVVNSPYDTRVFVSHENASPNVLTNTCLLKILHVVSFSLLCHTYLFLNSSLCDRIAPTGCRTTNM